MKIVKIGDIKNTDRDVKCPHGGFSSYRVLLEKDNMGFSLHKTVIPKNGWQHWHYKNHLEACYCIKGVGQIKSLEDPLGTVHEISPDTIYVLDKHDDHMFRALTDEVVLISVFNPPVKGDEVHDKDGSYKS
jgi:L-ectoine synthase